MTRLVLKIFDWLRVHRRCGISIFAIFSIVLVIQFLTINYKEDISDFLPLDSNHQNALKVYQDISGANKMFAIFQYKDTTQSDPDRIVEAVNAFTADLKKRDTTSMVKNLTAQVDMEKMAEVSDFVYDNIPYFLTRSDYARMDSLLADGNYVRNQLAQDKQLLMFPDGGLLSGKIQCDPLNFFTPVVAKLQRSSSLKYEMYDGYIFSPDMKRAIVMMSSPFGSSETEKNARLLSLLESSSGSMAKTFDNIDIHIIGGPAIAVGNASQIKTDSILAVSLSSVLIFLLLLYSFRSFRNLLLIFASITWGALFAFGGLSLIHDNVSIIVIGISSVILGIAVNYPLHVISHLSHTPDIRNALKEIAMPLVVGNITTVGAFLTLVPLQSVALRDLGLFSSFLLIGTILFAIIILPHIVKVSPRVTESHSFISHIGNISLENKPYIVVAVVMLTGLFAYFSFDTQFDANMGHINYMTEEQRQDMAYFQHNMQTASSDRCVYVLSSDSTLDGALDKSQSCQSYLNGLKQTNKVSSLSGCTQFVVSKNEQLSRLALWNEFVRKYDKTISQQLAQYGAEEGFSLSSFTPFLDILHGSYPPKDLHHFDLLSSSVFSSNISVDSVNRRYNVVDVLTVRNGDTGALEKEITDRGLSCFDLTSLNSNIANNLSNNFNYIGWACAFIVFFFLWFSFGSIELAALSFLPMALSWLWILGIMSVCGIQFNIVNIILATFIFGQGDDYTIFMTEGCCYEYAYRKKMLASYKNSIILSALIMFVGIGTLIVAKHPALHSLAEVTIVGMFSVILMAYLFPPLIFNWLVKKKGVYRARPISILPLCNFYYAAFVFFIQLTTVYALGFLLFVVMRCGDRGKALFHRYVQWLYTFDLHHMPTIKYHLENKSNENFDEPALIISNHQSMLDAPCFMSLTSKAVIIADKNASMNMVIRKIFKWLDFITLEDDESLDIQKLKSLKDKGYSIVVFPEGERNKTSSILRFHKGAFYLAEQLDLDIVPVFIHGLNNVLPRNSVSLYPGSISIVVGERIRKNDASYGDSYVSRTKIIHQQYKSEYVEISKRIETASYYRLRLLDCYRYKGIEYINKVKRNLKKTNCYSEWIDNTEYCGNVFVLNGGVGDFPILYALVHPDAQLTVYDKSEDNRRLTTYSADRVVNNIDMVQDEKDMLKRINDCSSKKVYLLSPDGDDIEKYRLLNPIIINLK